MGIEILFLILAVAVVAFGIGVIVVSRRNSASTSAPPARPARPTTPPPEAAEGDVLVAERPVEEVVEPELEPEPVKPASLRDRLAKARLAFTGAFAGVLGRSGITEESFEDLEEALLRADVGVGVTTELIDGFAREGRREGDHRAAGTPRRARGGDGVPARGFRSVADVRAG